MEKFKVELHVHTKFSHDSNLPFWLIYLMCRIRGITHIAITEHNNLQGAIAFDDYCKSKGNKLKVIKGEEIMTLQGEIIGLFLTNEIKAGLTPDETIRLIKEQNGIVYVPHPYDEKRYKTVLKPEVLAKCYRDVDFIECYNGRNSSEKYGEQQTSIANKYGIAKVIGADSHIWFELGRNYLITTICPESIESFKIAVANAEFHKSKCLKLAHFGTKFDRFLKFIVKGDFYGLYRFINKKLGQKI